LIGSRKNAITSAMTDYKIITVPHPALKQVATPVDTVDSAVRNQMDAMLRAMYDAPGIGLAANQVNMLNRVLVMDLKKRSERGYEDDEEQDDTDQEEGSTTDGPICMVNPEIIYESEEMSVMEEGCLSIPRQYAEVERPKIVRVKYLNYDGKPAELKASGLLSHCVQHEIDHLNGVLFIDYLSSLKRKMILKKVDKLKKQNLL
jgi:peptide deformylase